MCGIVGILGQAPVAGQLVEALKRLEYRGYDSAGIATLHDGVLDRRRAEGKLRALDARLFEAPLAGTIGIGHTRWATHGAPVERNAHPHMVDGVAIVHNGIIENFRELRDGLIAGGATFTTETDSEVIAHLIAVGRSDGLSPADAVAAALGKLEGAFALAVLFDDQDDLLIGARRGSPLAVGHGDGEMFLGSDAFALAPFTNRVTYLDEGDWAIVTRSGVEVRDASGAVVDREVVQTLASALLVDRGNHRHFMAKEIHEQPEVVSHTLSQYINMADATVNLPDLGVDLAQLDRVTISACGTAYYAGFIAKYWIERLARLPVEIDVASEFRYREPPLPKTGLAVFVSQSGETADTLAALRYCKEGEQRIASVVNVQESSIARESDVLLPTLAGPEIGVASTKAFMSQITVLACLALGLAKARGLLDREKEAALIGALTEIPRHLAAILQTEPDYERLCLDLAKASDVLYLGRGSSYPIALEGALKLKEISYIHAEGYAAGELKHGPIALIDEDTPVVVIAPKDALFDKTVSNCQEVAARGGRIYLVSDCTADDIGCALAGHMQMPTVDPFVSPFITALPAQLLAYHTAVHMGTDVDQPRNLAKSVTVE